MKHIYIHQNKKEGLFVCNVTQKKKIVFYSARD